MKKLMFVLVILAVLLVPSTAGARESCGGNGACTTIPSGELTASTGEVLTTGFDVYGYNYQAHQYVGYYGNYQRPPEPVDWGYRLAMKWNDAWLSNKDCDGDGKLDRHYGYDSYIGSGAWCTNHQSGTYVGDDGNEHTWTWFVKIVAKPTADYDCAAQGGIEIWGSFCEIESVYNDPYGGFHGPELKAVRPGLGNW